VVVNTNTPTGAYALDPLKDSRHRDARSARDLADWLAWLELGNKAARTLDAYERYAAVLLRSFPNTAFEDFTDGDLAHVLAEFPPRSRHIVKAAWNNWFKWGYKTRRIPGNPIEMLPSMTYKPNRSYDVYGVGEVEALCALPTLDGALLTLMFWGGLRRSEARMLTGRRLDLDQRQVIVTEGAKGGKSRRVPMTARVATASAELLLLEGIGDSDYLWYDRPGGTKHLRRSKPISNSTFDLWWKRVHQAADVRRRNPHMARHTFATRLRELGVPMEDIQQHLGHESMRTTADTYVHSNMADRAERLREAVGAM
jgi:integrase